MNTQTGDISLAQAARLAGIGYLLMIVIAPFSYGYVYSGLIVPGDASTSISNIQDNEFLFRVGISAFLIVMLADVLVSIGLYYFLLPVNRGIAILAAWLRIIYVAIFTSALTSLFDLLHIVSVRLPQWVGAESLQAQADFMRLVNHFDTGWLIGLVFFAFHLILIAWLMIKSHYIPSLLGVLVMIAGMGYLIDSFAHFLIQDYEAYKDIFLVIVLVPATLGEFSLCFWLLFKGNGSAAKALE
jgi:hypothetical protein